MSIQSTGPLSTPTAATNATSVPGSPANAAPSAPATPAPVAGAAPADATSAAVGSVNFDPGQVDLNNIGNNIKIEMFDGALEKLAAQGALGTQQVHALEDMEQLLFGAQTAVPAPAGGSAPPPAPAPQPTGGSAPPPAPAPAPTNQWQVGTAGVDAGERSFASVGDPHQTTGDGTHFDLEANDVFSPAQIQAYQSNPNSPEMTADITQLKSSNGDFSLTSTMSTDKAHKGNGNTPPVMLNQKAQVQYTNNSKTPPVTDTVAFDATNKQVTINGQAQSLSPGQTIKLPGGGSVSLNGDGSLQVTTDKGDSVNMKPQVWDHGFPYMDITGSIGPNRKDNEVRGAMGNFHSGGADAGADFIGADGHIYNPGALDKNNHAGDSAEMRAFLQSWIKPGTINDGTTPAGGAGPTGGGFKTTFGGAPTSSVSSADDPDGGAAPAGAKKKTHHLGLQGRVESELDRIQEGLMNGWLSPAQASALQARVDEVEGSIQRDEAEDKDHKLTPAQQKALEHRLNHLSGDIFQEKQHGHVRKLEKDGKLTKAQAHTLNQKINESAHGIRQDGGQLGPDYTALIDEIKGYEKDPAAPNAK